MATVHPSRMSLVPSDARDSYYSRRDPSPNRTYHRDYDERRRRSEEWNQNDSLDNRRLQRERATANVWPSSPKAPARDLSADSDRRHKRSKRRDRSPLSDESTDESSEEDRRRRERKQRKRAKKGKDKESEDRRNKSRRKSRRSDDGRVDDRHERDDRRRRRRRRRSSSQKSIESREKSPSQKLEEDIEDEWVEKPAEGSVMAPPPAPSSSMPASENKDSEPSIPRQGEDGSDVEVGPLPAPAIGGKANKRIDERQYGGALLRGEGSAMAAFLQEDTNVRIPRRGEIGLTSDEIATFENVGYVMSGSRHKRMNAVRIRKENQVISAEERRGILKLQKEERERREAVLREEFQELMDEKLKGTSARSSAQ